MICFVLCKWKYYFQSHTSRLLCILEETTECIFNPIFKWKGPNDVLEESGYDTEFLILYSGPVQCNVGKWFRNGEAIYIHERCIALYKWEKQRPNVVLTGWERSNLGLRVSSFGVETRPSSLTLQLCHCTKDI